MSENEDIADDCPQNAILKLMTHPP